MRISHQKKFVMISVPKTGSTTLRKFLDPLSDVMSNGSNKTPYYDHTTASSLKSHFESMDWDWDSYFKFGFVRNPWDWMVSHWFYRAKFIGDNEHKKHELHPLSLDFLHTCLHQFGNSMGFSEWCVKFGLGEFKNQSEWLYEDGVCLVDHVGKVEEFQNSVDIICDELKLDRQILSKKNKTNHEDYTSYYTPETRKAVAKKFSKDIEYFGYEFGK